RVHDALQYEIEPTFPVAADEPDDCASQCADANGEESHPERNACPINNAAEDIAANIVGAEGVLPARRRQTDLRLGEKRIIGRQHIRKNCRKHNEENDRSRSGSERLALHKIPQSLYSTPLGRLL